jgi:DNA-binding XRE family transcriptional regulator
MSNIVSGRQLRAARILAGLTQKQLAQAVGVHERAARYWELKEDKPPTTTCYHLERIEAALRGLRRSRIYTAYSWGAALPKEIRADESQRFVALMPAQSRQ